MASVLPGGFFNRALQPSGVFRRVLGPEPPSVQLLPEVPMNFRPSLLIAALSVSGLAPAVQAQAQNAPPVNTPDVNSTVAQVGNTVNGALGQTAGTAGQLGNTLGNTANGALGQVGNTAGQVVGGLQPTLQPVTQGVGGALNNLTQPDTVRSLLEFLQGVIPNHIEAHVNLDALRVEKLTVDVRGVDLRNLRVDLLVANSRNAGQVRPALNNNSNASSASNTGTASNTAGSGTNGTGTALPGDVPISGATTRSR
jgi:hypothetical protein